MLSLSIVLPWRGPDQACEDTLVSLLQNRPRDCEIVVVHAGEHGDPYDLAGEVRFVAAPAACGLIEQINCGFLASRGVVAHLVQPGLEVEDGWTETALEPFSAPHVAAVAPVVLEAHGERIVTAGVRRGVAWARKTTRRAALLRTTMCSDGPDLLAGFWRRSAWEQTGGFDPAFGDRFADLDLAVTLHELGFTAVVDAGSRLRQTTDCSAPASAWEQGRFAERLFWKHVTRRRRGASLALHAAAVALESIAALPRPNRWMMIAGRLLTIAELPLTGRRRQAASPRDGHPEPASSGDSFHHREPAVRFPNGGLRGPNQPNPVRPTRGAA